MSTSKKGETPADPPGHYDTPRRGKGHPPPKGAWGATHSGRGSPYAPDLGWEVLHGALGGWDSPEEY